MIGDGDKREYFNLIKGAYRGISRVDKHLGDPFYQEIGRVNVYKAKKNSDSKKKLVKIVKKLLTFEF